MKEIFSASFNVTDQVVIADDLKVVILFLLIKKSIVHLKVK